ncbi:flavodoxin domain-containing protein [Nocardia bovistercoris]|uniref:Flavodoxin n=1 Tax=Nocardia bovistercoris TaxID=2785916 RepID=A0A931N7T4_9NOCA|nr:flavodoxin domain-containing protein [Nocardia bovistercoris]MBH0781073.1 flavodoxin [Nocardia bovistercoris]
MESNNTRIAVLYATAQGSCRDIAEFIAAHLIARGARVELAEVEHAPELELFDAVVFGSAVHDRALLPEADAYLRTHRDALTSRPVWLFSVGIGPSLRGPIGRRLARIVPPDVAEIREMISPRAYRAFAGYCSRADLPVPSRVVYRLIGGARYGDLRDWDQIRDWTDNLADELGLPSTDSEKAPQS